MSGRCSRREALALLGAGALIGPGMACAAQPSARPLLVVLGDPAGHERLVGAARSRDWEVATVSEPMAGWRERIGPALVQGRMVVGVGDAGYAFCLEHLARGARCVLARGRLEGTTARFVPYPTGLRVPPPARGSQSAAWRLVPSPFGQTIL